LSALYLIRHGQAGPRNDYDRLSDLGARQAELLGVKLAAQGMEFDAVYSGALARQKATARLVGERYEAAGVPFPQPCEDPLWNEFDLGDVYAQIAGPLARDNPRFARAFAALEAAMEDPEHDVHRSHSICDIEVVRAWVAGKYPYEGESWAAFQARILTPLKRLAESDNGGKVAVFTSATPIGICVAHALGADETHSWKLAGVAYNSGVSTLRVARAELRLFSFNSVGHLEDPNHWSFK